MEGRLRLSFRWGLRAALYLAAGAMVTILLAWGCAIWRPILEGFPVGKPANVLPAGERPWMRVAGPGYDYYAADPVQGLGEIEYFAVHYTFAGWPFQAMSSSEHISNFEHLSGGRGVGWMESFDRGNGLPRKAGESWLMDPRLPLIPMFWGFLGDSMLYVGMILLMAKGWRWLRKRMKAPRGFEVVRDHA